MRMTTWGCKVLRMNGEKTGKREKKKRKERQKDKKERTKKKKEKGKVRLLLKINAHSKYSDAELCFLVVVNADGNFYNIRTVDVGVLKRLQ